MKDSDKKAAAKEKAIQETKRMVSENIKKMNSIKSILDYDPYTQWYLPGASRTHLDPNAIRKIPLENPDDNE